MDATASLPSIAYLKKPGGLLPETTSLLLQEDGTSHFLLENGTDKLKLENGNG